jgi:hypothetical protein
MLFAKRRGAGNINILTASLLNWLAFECSAPEQPKSDCRRTPTTANIDKFGGREMRYTLRRRKSHVRAYRTNGHRDLDAQLETHQTLAARKRPLRLSKSSNSESAAAAASRGAAGKFMPRVVQASRFSHFTAA